MSEGDRSAVDVETFRIECPQSCGQLQGFAAVGLVGPSRPAGEHLRRKGLVDLPQVDVGQRQPVPQENRRRRVHRPQPHLRRVEPGPLAVTDPAERLEPVPFDRRLRGQNQPRGAVGDLRTVARCNAAVGLVEERLQLSQRGRRRISPHAVVLGQDGALRADQRHDLGITASGTRLERAPMAVDGQGVHRFTRDAEAPGQILCGLPHRQADHRIGQPLEDTDHRRKQGRR